MAGWVPAARQVTKLARLSTPKPPSLVHRRHIATGEHHGSRKVNFWEDPFSPSTWKEEHFVIVSVAGRGLLFYGGYNYFSRDKNDKEKKTGEAAREARKQSVSMMHQEVNLAVRT